MDSGGTFASGLHRGDVHLLYFPFFPSFFSPFFCWGRGGIFSFEKCLNDVLRRPTDLPVTNPSSYLHAGS